MGVDAKMPWTKIFEGIRKHPAYLGFFVCEENKNAAQAKSNLNFSTWQSKYILNIHYFVISPDFREKGVGMFLLNEIEEYAKQEEFCHSNLEIN